MKLTTTITFTSIAIVSFCLAPTLYRNSVASAAKESYTFLRGATSGSRDLQGTEDGGRSRIGISSSSSTAGLTLAITDDSDAPPCSVHVTLTCPTEEPIAIDNDCIDPFQVMSFRYNGGDCSQSNTIQDRLGFFTCTDTDATNPPSTVEGTEHYIVVTSRSGNETYFAGNVAVGEEYTWNANEAFDVLESQVTITVYDSFPEDEEGSNSTVLQTTEVAMDCSDPLFLFDRFGSSQVTAWKETTGRIVSSAIDTKRTGTVGIQINNHDSNTPIVLKEMTLLANMQDAPVPYTNEIENVTLASEEEFEVASGFTFEYDLGANRTRYIFFTTVIAEPEDGSTSADGSVTECNNHAQLECIF